MTTNCPKCSGVLVKSTTLVPGHTTNRCITCNTLNVEGSPHWPTNGPGVMRQLIDFAMDVEEANNIWREAFESDGGDRRWTLIEIFEGGY
jgi:hypothetical protein